METTTESVRRAGARRVGRWAGNTVLVAVMLLAALWLAPSLMGYSRYVITGPSMTGSYDKGSVVFSTLVDVDDLAVGDMITYLPPASSGVPNLVTHRIFDIEPAQGGGRLFTTKGDANPTPDPWHFELVDSEQPVVQHGVPHVGWVFIALADREVRIALIGVPAAVIALLSLRDLAAAVRRPSRAAAAGAATVAAAPTIPSHV